MADELTNQQGSGMGAGPASRRYSTMRLKREPVLVRARRISRLTVPTLFREIGENQTTGETLPWQSLGGYGLNNLAGTLVLGGFPPGIANINIKPTRQVLSGFLKLPADVRGHLKDATDKALAQVEQDYVDCCEEDGDRTAHFDTMRHLLCGGSHAIHLAPKDAKLQSYSLDQHVVRRDASGTVLEAIIDKPMEFESLPKDVQDMVSRMGYKNAVSSGSTVGDNYSSSTDSSPPAAQPISVFTHICLEDGKYRGYQECYGAEVPGSRFTYNTDALPWLFIPMVRLRGEDYGRSYFEDYEGDLQAYDGFWQMLTEGTAAIVRLIWLIKAGGITNKKAFAEAQNGDVITGDMEDVGAAHSEHQADMETALKIALKVEARLEKLCLLYTPREGERVTQEEIQQTIKALQQGLGGLFSNLNASYFGPFNSLKLAALMRQGRITPLPKGTTKIKTLTGDAALGRYQRAQALDELIATTVKALGAGAAAAMPYVDIGTYLERGAANRSIDSDGLIKTDDQVQAEAAQQNQQAQGQQLSQAVAPEVVRQGGQMMQNQQQANLAPPADPSQQQPTPAPAGA